MRLHAYAPTRIDLAGGTLDIWPLYLFHPGALTVNLAVTRYAHCLLESRRDPRIVLHSRDTSEREEFASLDALLRRTRYRLPLLAHLVGHFRPRKGLTVSTWSQVPEGSGLGGSSALAVALAAALTRWQRARLRSHDWVTLARDIEARILSVPTGEQDHYPAVFGGASAIHLEPRRVWREGLKFNLRALEARLILVYTGKPRQSGINNWEVFKNHLEGDRRLRENFSRLAEISVAMRKVLLREDWNALARLLRREWQGRRRNAPAISTPLIDRLIRLARKQGAQAAKVCGAGGGGCVVFLAPPKRRAAVVEALAAAGAGVLPFRVARQGVRVKRLP